MKWVGPSLKEAFFMRGLYISPGTTCTRTSTLSYYLSFSLSPCPLFLPSVSPSSSPLPIWSLPDYQPPWDSSLSLPWPLVLDLRPSGDSAWPFVSLLRERAVLFSLPLCAFLSFLSYLVECELDLCLLCVCLIVLRADLHGGEVMWLRSYLFGSMELAWCSPGSIS